MEIIFGVGNEDQARKLTEKKILNVRRIDRSGKPYAWIVKLANYGDIYDFKKVDERGRATFEYYPVEDLPEAVQSFINKRTPKKKNEMSDMTDYIYKK